MAELPLDHDERHAFARHFDRVGVTQLMRGEPPANAGRKRGVAKSGPGGRAGPLAAGRRTGKHAEERPDREFASRGKPWLELSPAPCVHAHLASPSTPTATDKQRAAALMEIGLGEGERLVDAKPGAPEEDNQAAQPAAVGGVARRRA